MLLFLIPFPTEKKTRKSQLNTHILRKLFATWLIIQQNWSIFNDVTKI